MRTFDQRSCNASSSVRPAPFVPNPTFSWRTQLLSRLQEHGEKNVAWTIWPVFDVADIEEGIPDLDIAAIIEDLKQVSWKTQSLSRWVLRDLKIDSTSTKNGSLSKYENLLETIILVFYVYSFLNNFAWFFYYFEENRIYLS